MKIARVLISGELRVVFEHSDGQWYDATQLLPDAVNYVQNWDSNLRALQEFDASAQVALDLSDVIYAPPFQATTFRDFYAFEDHVKTCRAKRGVEMNPDWYEIPVFYFSNPFSIIGHDAEVYAPAGSQELDFELELGIVIGEAGRDIRAEDAWNHVAGFTIINDLSARDLQRKEMSLQLGPAKGKDFATAVGPCLVSLDELRGHISADGKIDLAMRAELNGMEISSGNAKTMYHSWPQLIEHASRDVDLQPGDLIGSGTVGTGCILELGAENVGSYLQPGDRIELCIDGIGSLNSIVTERPDHARV